MHLTPIIHIQLFKRCRNGQRIWIELSKRSTGGLSSTGALRGNPVEENLQLLDKPVPRFFQELSVALDSSESRVGSTQFLNLDLEILTSRTRDLLFILRKDNTPWQLLHHLSKSVRR